MDVENNVIKILPQTSRHTATVYARLAGTHPHCSHSVQLVAGIEEGIRQMMEIPSCSSNSHTTQPLLRLGVFTPLIDSLSLFPFQESLSRLSTRLTFPRTPSSSRSRGSWTPWAAFPQCSLDLHVDRGHSIESVDLMNIYKQFKHVLCNRNVHRKVFCV